MGKKKKIDIKLLSAAGAELNEEWGLTGKDTIDTELACKPLAEAIKEVCNKYLDPEDELSEETVKVLEQLGCVEEDGGEDEEPGDTSSEDEGSDGEGEEEGEGEDEGEDEDEEPPKPSKKEKKKVEKKEEPAKKKEEPAKKKAEKPVKKKSGYCREFSVVDALTKKGQTLEDLSVKADVMYAKESGKSNTKQSAHVTKLVLKPLVYIGAVVCKSDKYSKA